MSARRLFTVVFFSLLLVVTSATDTFAQPGDPNDPDNPVPITGLEYLVGGGILYGVRSLLKARKDGK